MSEKLTPKQAMFIDEYLVDGNATRAAIAVGFSVASAKVTGARLLKKPVIAALITERQAHRARRLEVTADRVTQELAKLAFYDVRDLFDDDGRLKQITELDEISAAAIAGIDIAQEKCETKFDKESKALEARTTNWTTKIKLADRRAALELLGKKLKMFTDVHEHSGRLTLEQLVCGDSEEAA
jgi:phage terminase small subunit